MKKGWKKIPWRPFSNYIRWNKSPDGFRSRPLSSAVAPTSTHQRRWKNFRENKIRLIFPSHCGAFSWWKRRQCSPENVANFLLRRLKRNIADHNFRRSLILIGHGLAITFRCRPTHITHYTITVIISLFKTTNTKGDLSDTQHKCMKKHFQKNKSLNGINFRKFSENFFDGINFKEFQKKIFERNKFSRNS